LGFTLLGPLIIWAIKKDESAYIRREGFSALTFSIAVLIVNTVLWVLSSFLCICWLLTPFIFIFHIFLGYKGFVATKNGQCFEYPFIADAFPPGGDKGSGPSQDNKGYDPSGREANEPDDNR